MTGRSTKGILRFDPVEGSFWEVGKKDPRIGFVGPRDDDTVCIGKVRLITKSRFEATTYKKPFKVDTKRKTEPDILDTRIVSTMAKAIWRIRHVHDQPEA